MRLLALSFGLLVLASSAHAQSDRGTITGTVADPAGAIVAGAPVEIKNVETGAVYQAGTSATGNYTLAQLPAGKYELSVTVPGFKRFVRQSIQVDVAETYRVDVVLEVGSAAESVTVTEAAPLLKTESGELSHTVTTATMNSLPVMSIGAAAGSSGIRNPYSVVQLLPGTTYSPDVDIRVNGLPANTQAMRIEGQDATNGWYSAQSQTQGSVEAMQEFAVQTSNYAAELGQAGGGLFNVTMRSGTNQFHGGAYEYFVNEFLNAGTPFTNNGNGELLRPRQRRNDWGFSLGGPVLIPKLYNGHDKAFFFFNFEHFGETIITNNTSTTVPTPAYRNGDFSKALTGRVLETNDGIGRPVMENEIYDPSTDFIVNGQRYRNQFPNNVIPMTRFDPVAVNIQNLIPLPLGPNANSLINNYLPTYANPKYTLIPSIKGDYQISAKSKISGFWSLNRQDNPNNGLMPPPIRSSQPRLVNSNTYRLNFEQTLTPTLLLHFGGGLVDTRINDHSDRFNSAQELGFNGANVTLFPVISGLSGNQGGMAAGMGPGNQIHLTYRKPTGNTTLTWVHGNHTYKFGGEFMVNGYQMFQETYGMVWLTYSPNETSMPALSGVSLPSTAGYGYASFLLGAVDNGFNAVPVVNHMGAHSISGFAQDSWKATRKLTLDYGLRYDFSTYLRDGNGYYLIWSGSTPNPNAGGRLGAIIGEGYGGGRCNCEYSKNYPFAWGPRIGLAYQITPKTVLRVGAGVSYYKTDNNNLGLSSVSQVQYTTASFGDPAYLTRNGFPYQITFPNFNPGQGLFPGVLGSAPQEQDRNAGRPARQFQWSLGIQRELTRDLLVEATYVGNRGAWWNAGGMVCTNCMTPQFLQQQYGLNITNAADRAVLASAVSSQLAVSRGFGMPYPGFPATASVAQSLRPFPQYPNITNWHWIPLGDTWYESLQVKATKRFTHGLEFSSAFTWAKQLTSGVEDDFGRGGGVIINDAFNRPNQKALSTFDQPLQFVISGSYTTPKFNADSQGMKALAWFARDWQIGTLLRYASGLPIAAPTSTNGLATYVFQSTNFNRVPGVPLFTQDLNCHCFDPNTTFVLNPAAWSNPAPGQWGTAAAYYSDYRYQRRPVENISLGRMFRIKERSSLQIRAEFTNIFNRTQMNNPTATNALASQVTTSTGQTTSGFGYINNATVFSSPRQGQLIARFSF